MNRPTLHRLSAVAMAVVALIPTSLAAGDGSAPAFHARRLGEAKSPPATLDQVAWLAGRWVGDGLGGVSEELWSPPAGGAMMGTYRLLKDGAPVFYEFLLLVEENGTLILKLKHFNPDFTGWEEKGDFVDFPLVAIEADAVYFDGLTFARQPDGSLRIYLLLRSRETGTEREELFTMRRAG
jgi:hypothetical protein